MFTKQMIIGRSAWSVKATLVAAATMLGGLGLPTAVHASTLKIMALGDSITLGVRGDEGTSGDDSRNMGQYLAGYRGPLQNLLGGTGYDFVGTIQDGPTTYGGQAFDSDHQGYPGIEADRFDVKGNSHINDSLRRKLKWGNNGSVSDVFGDLAGAGQTPDVILLHIGTNTLTDGSDSVDPLNNNNAAAQLVRLLDFLRDETELSNTKIVIAQVIPQIKASSGDLQRREDDYTRTQTYNSQILDIISDYLGSADPDDQAFGSRLSTVDMFNAGSWVVDTDNDGIPDSVDTNSNLLDSDGIHPTQAGYDLMASVWYQGLVGLGLTGTVPEPGTLMIAAAGCFCLLTRGRRRAA